ncbi:heterokaryon incompatibility protein-domain-containing protein [Lophiotrema nucula]|uniref:Heterokaryon incompatibility protein-domain-containing protein n=1 Tax=Lophiotrema nucula TaxID=690887 RepID=A0A6A5ZDX7_9PLEO|nr:heterokaryon incompatibility protein-domain-containing protein [Lophiotrema nucula]
MKAWLKVCRTRHPKCGSAQQAYAPTRLLELNTFDASDDIRLVTPGIRAATEYVALSHCWGPPEKWSLQTTNETIEARSTRIPFTDLSRTFQDAVRITRDLGFHYLWIDSLCIIQQDRSDFEREAAAMADVYTNAVCTLAALASADSTEGCRVRDASDPPHAAHDEENVFYQTANLHVGDTMVRLSSKNILNWDFHYSDLGHHPLSDRSWTLQERLLSVRNISFGEFDSFWECRTAKGMGDRPWPQLNTPGDPEEDERPWPTPLTASEGVLSTSAWKRDEWYHTVEEYTRRSLTHQSDKLPALAGIVKQFQAERESGIFLNGLFAKHLPSSLLWTVVRDPYSQPGFSRQESYRAPSWSWASINGPVSYKSQRMLSTNVDTEVVFGDLNFNITALKFHVDPDGFDAFGLIQTAATLALQGKLIQLGLAKVDEKYEETMNLRLLVRTNYYNNDDVVGAVYLDVESELGGTQDVWCLPVRKEHWLSEEPLTTSLRYRMGPMVMGLALLYRPLSDTFVRVGMIRWVKTSIFDATEPRPVRID